MRIHELFPIDCSYVKINNKLQKKSSKLNRKENVFRKFFKILEGNCTTTFKNSIYCHVSIANFSCLLSHCNAQLFEDKVNLFISRDREFLLVLDYVQQLQDLNDL